MKLMRHKVTGRTGTYPDHYADVFPALEPVDEVPCTDCIPTVDVVEYEYEDPEMEYEEYE